MIHINSLLAIVDDFVENGQRERTIRSKLTTVDEIDQSSAECMKHRNDLNDRLISDRFLLNRMMKKKVLTSL